ncbi:MAG: hypothetical protein COZ80_05965 [Ignavibacteria bacterium CG_4_8_14_3_um_filter_37_9]|nr:MAG: hypothetical protein COZ80_05965 [Ignavibacteria bacterium CG_4_8_14_3_um_filter_37_9]PIX93155.1 MAG: hypothetical protein COZ25_12110 [Ignavibacteria bacterium CG_4_10_14_3_um_filter_37_18]
MTITKSQKTITKSQMAITKSQIDLINQIQISTNPVFEISLLFGICFLEFALSMHFTQTVFKKNYAL